MNLEINLKRMRVEEGKEMNPKRMRNETNTRKIESYTKVMR